MNKRLIVLLVCCLPVLAWAEADEAKMQTDFVDKRVARLTKELSLTTEQQAKVKTIFETQRDKIKAVHDETHASLKEVFTPEQQTKFEKFHEELKARRQAKKQHRQKMAP